MKFADRLFMVMMNKKEKTTGSGILSCIALILFGCSAICFAVALPGARVFFIVLAVIMFLSAAGVIASNIHKNRPRW